MLTRLICYKKPLREAETVMDIKKRKYSLGIDFGTNSVRAVVAALDNGEEAGSSVYDYRRGENGVITSADDPNFARQDPAEYFKGMEDSVKKRSRRRLKSTGGISALRMWWVSALIQPAAPLYRWMRGGCRCRSARTLKTIRMPWHGCGRTIPRLKKLKL